MAQQQRRRLGDILLEEGKVRQDQLEKAVEEQARTGKYLGAVLLSLGFCTEEDICMALSNSSGIPFVDLRDYEVSAEALKALPPNLAKECKAVPLNLQGTILTVAMSDPLNFNKVMKIETACGVTVEAWYATETSINEVIEREYSGPGGRTHTHTGPAQTEVAPISSIQSFTPPSGDTEPKTEEEAYEESIVDLSKTAAAGEESSPAVRIVEAVIKDAVGQKATDIHIEPNKANVGVRFRIDGLLFDQRPVPLSHLAAVVARIKILASIDIAEKRLPQGGKIQTNIGGKEYELRVSTFPTIYGEKVVIRILSKDSGLLRLTSIGMKEEHIKVFEDLGNRPNGILLVTGPTGSGKTTSLYSLLNTVKSTHKNIHTLEDPVEYRLEGINQTQINPKADLTFERSLREMLRQDPDVILIGEIRDPETAAIAIHASLTGHLVISTLHTNSSSAAIARLTKMGIENYLVASSVIGIIAQRLARCLCEKCKNEDTAGRAVFTRYHEPLEPNLKIFKNGTCRFCHNSGFKDRTGVFEILIPDEEIQNLIIHDAPAQAIEKSAVDRHGMLTLMRAGFQLVREGRTSLTEIMRVVC
jgi:type IV pilus assembly protein PilB